MPGLGPIATMSGCMYLDRASKNDKEKTKKDIIARQALSEENPNYDPLIIYPEGGTTNGTHLLKFKSGAFFGLKSI